MSEDRKGPRREHPLSRRQFLGWAGAGAMSAGVLGGIRVRRRAKLDGTVQAAELPPAARGYRKAVVQAVTLNVNGIDYPLQVDTRTTLSEALREHLHLTGTHVTCDRGECGACTVLMDGRAVYSCTILALQARGKKILTVEGLAKDGKLDPIQEAFVEQEAFQCGYCTSGQMLAVKALLLRNPNPTEADVRQAVAGNICRCGTYPSIVQAALKAAAKTRG